MPPTQSQGGIKDSYGYGAERVFEELDAIVPQKLAEKEIVKEGLSEYFLYTIEGTETVSNGSSKRLASLKANDVPVKNLYKFEQDRYGSSVVRFLSFRNDVEHKLGLTPLPDGQIRVFRSVDQDDRLAYVGESAFKYVPVGEEVELDLGQAQDLTVEPRLMDFKRESFRFDGQGDISGWDEIRAFDVAVNNTRQIKAEVEIKRNLQTTYWDLTKTGTVSPERVDKDTVKFTLGLPARSSQAFGYEVRTFHGTREADWQAGQRLTTQIKGE